MKIYRCDCFDDDLGCRVSWHPSKREAEQHLRVFQQERNGEAMGPESVKEVNVPTTKRDLLRWLNANFTSDNG